MGKPSTMESSPNGRRMPSQLQYRLIKLRSDLRNAVEEEEYETAARIRDEIQSLEKDFESESRGLERSSAKGAALTGRGSLSRGGCAREKIRRQTRSAHARGGRGGEPRRVGVDIDTLTHTSGEWLRGTGPESDIVISSRIRLARNLAQFAFPNRADDDTKTQIEDSLRSKLDQLRIDTKLSYVDVARLENLDRQFLVERQLISREHAEAHGSARRRHRR